MEEPVGGKEGMEEHVGEKGGGEEGGKEGLNNPWLY